MYGMEKLSKGNNVDLAERQKSFVDMKVKLPPVELQQLSSVLQEAIRKLQIFSVLPHIIENCEKYKNVIGSELLELLGKHKIILESFKELKVLDDDYCREIEKLDDNYCREIEKVDNDTETTAVENTGEIASTSLPMHDNTPGNERQNSFITTSHKERIQNQIEKVQRNLNLVVQKMKFSSRIILRLLVQNPLFYKTMIQYKDLPNSNKVADIIDKVETLKRIFSKKLSIPTEEKLVKLKAFNSNIEQNIKQMISKLENKVPLIENELKYTLSSENEKTDTLLKTMEEIKTNHEDKLLKIRFEVKKEELTCYRNQQNKTKKLKSDLEVIESKHEAALEIHVLEETQLRKKKYKVEVEFEAAVQNFDKEMMERQKELEATQTLYAQEKQMLENTEQKFRALKVEFDRIMENRRANEKKLQKEYLEKEKLVRAVTVIQSMWRSYKVNKVIKSKKKKANVTRKKSIMKKS